MGYVYNIKIRVKLFKFNGKEDWKIWYIRFDEIEEWNIVIGVKNGNLISYCLGC